MTVYVNNNVNMYTNMSMNVQIVTRRCVMLKRAIAKKPSQHWSAWV